MICSLTSIHVTFYARPERVSKTISYTNTSTVQILAVISQIVLVEFMWSLKNIPFGRLVIDFLIYLI
jgi:hypothetical protein